MGESFPKSAIELIAEILQSHGVEFIVIGGQAELMYGAPPGTIDVDLCYRRNQGNLDRLASALRSLQPTLRGAPADLPFILDAKTLEMGHNFTLSTSLVDLDLIGWVEPIGDYESLITQAESFQIADLKIPVIGLDDLIRIKQHIARPKDRQSLLQLLAIKRLREKK